MARSELKDPRKLYVGDRLSCRTELRGHLFAFEVQVTDVDARGILTSIPELAGEALPTGQEILVRYYRSDAAYQFLSAVAGYLDSGESYRMRIRFPSRITRLQRRSEQRAPVQGTVAYRFGPQGLKLRGILVDLSAGGAHFTTPMNEAFVRERRPLGRKVLVDLNLKGGREFHGVQSSILRIVQDPDVAQNVRVHIRFEGLDEQAAGRIRKVVDRALK